MLSVARSACLRRHRHSRSPSLHLLVLLRMVDWIPNKVTTGWWPAVDHVTVVGVVSMTRSSMLRKARCGDKHHTTHNIIIAQWQWLNTNFMIIPFPYIIALCRCAVAGAEEYALPYRHHQFHRHNNHHRYLSVRVCL